MGVGTDYVEDVDDDLTARRDTFRGFVLEGFYCIHLTKKDGLKTPAACRLRNSGSYVHNMRTLTQVRYRRKNSSPA